MPIIRRVLPSALICIDERELDAYRPFVPETQLLVHPPMDGFAVVCNWIMDNVKNETLFFCDDDFRRVLILVGWRRSGRGTWTDDPEEILAIIENAARCAKDVGSTSFAFSRTGNAMLLRPTDKPIRPVPVLSNAFGIRGDARHRKMDPRFSGRNAIDLSLRTLLEDRFGYQDVRFYFDCGQIFAGRGGNVGLVTADRFAQSTLALKETWGSHVSFKRSAIDQGQIDAMKITVKRTNSRAQR